MDRVFYDLSQARATLWYCLRLEGLGQDRRRRREKHAGKHPDFLSEPRFSGQDCDAPAFTHDYEFIRAFPQIAKLNP